MDASVTNFYYFNIINSLFLRKIFFIILVNKKLRGIYKINEKNDYKDYCRELSTKEDCC